MNELQVFNYNAHAVRIIERDGEPWWVLKDVCKILGLSNVTWAANRLDEDERCLVRLNTPGGKQDMAVINEPGLYNIILRSDKPEAKAFKRWVIHDVLPSIRKTGGYNTSGVGFEERLKMAQIFTKCTKYTLPYVTDVFRPYLSDSVTPVSSAQTNPKPHRTISNSVVDFLESYVPVIGKPTNEVYNAYCDYCNERNTVPAPSNDFSRQVNRAMDIRITDKKIKGIKYRIFVK